MSVAEAPTGIWARLKGSGRVPSDGGAWSRVRELVDPASWRPKLADDVEIKEFHLRWGNDYAMVANPRDLIHYRLTPSELEVVRMMDGSRTVKELVLDRFQESGELELANVIDLVRELRVGNFLSERYVDVGAAVDRALHPESTTRKRLRGFVRTLSIEWPDAERLVSFLYRRVFPWTFSRWAQLPMAAVSLGGFAVFLLLVAGGEFELAGGSHATGSLILLALSYLLTFIHELGHAMVLVHYGRRVKSAGFMIYFGSPSFFVDASDGLMMERWPRIMQAFAGPYGESIVAGLAAIIAFTFPDAPFAEILYTFAVLNYLVLFLNLIPLLELDGYWILSDLIQVPDLRPRSLVFIRHDLWAKLRGRERLSKQEVGLAAYGIVGVVFTIFCFYTAFFFWREIFGGLVVGLWEGGPWLRLLLVALALFITGPAIRGLIQLARSLFRRLRAVWADVRFRLERGWRVEAARMIDALPLFEDLPVETLNALAGRARQRSVAAGEPVFRQGDRADAFYVVRRGTVQVQEERPDGVRPLRTLGPGDSFGELGVLEGRPRNATVRALEESHLFVVDRGTFERLLAEAASQVPQFAPTLQALSDLRALSCFAHLLPDELALLLEHGRWVQLPPGATVIEEGRPGDAFYAIESGQAEVIRDGEVQATLGPGRFFGEVALLLDVPRTASVVARTPVRAYRLDRGGFDRVLAASFRGGVLRPNTAVDRTWHH